MKLSLFHAIIPVAGLLTACGPQTETAPEVPVDPYELAGATVRLEGESALASALAAPAGITVESDPDGGFVTLSGAPATRNSAGQTSGATIEIAGEAEQALSGRLIEITIIARSSDGGVLDAAYSTNDVGNSGWSSFSLTPDFGAVTFTYETREMNAGRNDYLGLIAKNGSIDIAAIAVRPAADAQ